MAFLRQVWTLMSKNFRIFLLRHTIAVVFMAFIVPLALAAFFSFAKNLFVPPAVFGIGTPQPVKSLSQAFQDAQAAGQHKIVLVDNGFTGGDIEAVLDAVASAVSDARPSMALTRTTSQQDLVTECRSSLRGVTQCYCAVVMLSSPSEGRGGIWNYTIVTDSTMANAPYKINVHKSSNAEEVYILPIQRVVDSAIASRQHADGSLLDRTREYPFTSQTAKQRATDIQEAYQQANIDFMGVAYIALVIWITYHLTGLIATERESGMSQLLDAMMPVSQPWMSLAARILSHHFSFCLMYAPAWILGSFVIAGGVFPSTSVGIVLILNLLSGVALASMSILYASFFKKAQLSGITAILVTLLLGILAQAITNPNTATAAVLSLLFTPCAYVYFILFLAHSERYHQPANLTKSPPHCSWEIPGIVIWIFLLIQIFVYPLLGALIEARFYGTATKGRKLQRRPDDAGGLGDTAVSLQNFTKIYPPTLLQRLFHRGAKASESVVAANELTFDVGRGQILALLGANGSGKSTTLDALAGLSKLTSGSIMIDGRGGLGIAPQKNVMWDELNVREHLTIFNRLKSPHRPASKQEIRELIESVDLTVKSKAQSKTLSGGQKRKLQLGMMLVGGSEICFVDEVSSGIDPLSRRKIWDIILRERGKRTMILTTHFLDEADLLADRIVILSKGSLRAEGSSVALKDKFGGGYRVFVQKSPGLRSPPDVEGVTKSDAFQHVTYTAPSSGLAAAVIRRLEDEGITDYRFSGPTIEDVFLNKCAEWQDEEALLSSDSVQGTPPAAAVAGENDTVHDTASPGRADERSGLKLMDGTRVSPLQQVAILFAKRLTILKRNYVPHALAFLIPIVAAGLTSLYIVHQNPTGCSPSAQSSGSSTQDAFTQVGSNSNVAFLLGPPSSVPSDAMSLLRPLFSGSSASAAVGEAALKNIQLVDTFAAFESFIENHRRNVTTALWLGDKSTPPTISWVANLFVTSCMTAQQFEDILLTNTTIATTWSTFAIPFTPNTGQSLQLITYMGIALSVFPGFFALYPSLERRRFVRALQYSNGIRPVPLWLAYLAFDLIFVLVSAALVTAIWAGVSSVFYHVGYIFLVFFLYGIASILLSYFVSLFTKTQLATFAWTVSLQGVMFLGYLIAYMCVVTYVPTDKIDSTILLCNFVLSAVLPMGSALRSLFVTLNLFSTACQGQHLSDNPGGILEFGGPILYLIVQCFVLFGLVLCFDTGSVPGLLRRFFERRRELPQSSAETGEKMPGEDEQVVDAESEEDGLRVKHLTKAFGKNTAVDNVTFGIKRGEVFALLGPNGAGKTTTISLIRGDMKPSRNGGDVFVEDVSVSRHLAAARRNLGVCPQVDAIDHMTVREHLEFYAKIRGIPDVEHNVALILRAVGLEAFPTRMAGALSGGNKRKLSLGIALMGNPTVVLLDEPSSGLDAASKRVMWKTLSTVVSGRSILLTTHSMEEADALAGRVGILARRMLALGSPDGLRRRYGDALHVHLVCASAPRTTNEEMQRIVSWIRQNFPSADVEDKTYHGQLRFSVEPAEVMAATRDLRPESDRILEQHVGDYDGSDAPRPGHSDRDRSSTSQGAIGHLVVLLEQSKARLGVEHFSVSPTTLDQVFLTIVGNHNVREENYETKTEALWRRLLRIPRS